MQQTSRVILAMVAMLDMEFDRLDIKTTFLNGNLEEEIYMQQSQGFMEQKKKDLVCRLKRYLYGLRQALYMV